MRLHFGQCLMRDLLILDLTSKLRSSSASTVIEIFDLYRYFHLPRAKPLLANSSTKPPQHGAPIIVCYTLPRSARPLETSPALPREVKHCQRHVTDVACSALDHFHINGKPRWKLPGWSASFCSRQLTST